MPAEDRETVVLRTALRELVALSTIPAAWVGREPPTIARGLADVLIGSLDLDFVFVRLCDPTTAAAIEVTGGDAWGTVPEWLRVIIGSLGQFSSTQVVTGPGGADVCRAVAIAIGVGAAGGLVVAACSRADFPTEIDQLLLSVGANHAATAFQHARLRHDLDATVTELRQAGNELEIKVAERTTELRQSEAYLADGQRLTHTGSWACTIAGEMRHSSEEHSRLYGFDPECGVPSTEAFRQRIHPDDRPQFVKTFEHACRSGNDFEAHFRVVLPDATTRYMHGVGHPVRNASGDLVEFVGILVDVTERRRADHERERLRQVQADLAYLSRVTTMGELTASLAHEIRQPIAAAVTDANTCVRWLTRQHPDVEEAREAAARVVRDATRAADIISSISRLFQKGARPREFVDVNELIREMVVLLRSQASRCSIAIRTELGAHVPLVEADRVQLQQVFMNLMLNGIDAMADPRGRHELIITSEADNARLLVSVRDTGVGLPADRADQIFSAFFSTKEHGIGMGLPISRSIIEAHGGRLWATGNADCGATFQFSLPAAPLAKSPSPVYENTQTNG